MQPDLFDMRARRLRRDRAARAGPALFLHERAFDDMVERLSGVRHAFRSALLIGASDPSWRARLERIAPQVIVIDPGPLFAAAAGGAAAQEDELDLEPGSFDLVVTAGTLDTVNDLPGALLRLRLLLKPDSLLIGAVAGGESLPRLRQAMRAADSASDAAAPRVHPRIAPAALSQLLASAGLEMPVVDVDRVSVAYRDLTRLIRDLRSMGSTNILTARSRKPLTRRALELAQADFARGSEGGRTTETFEILHFAGWSPAEDGEGWMSQR